MLCARFNLAQNSFRLDVDITVPEHGITVVFGPSGSGKTTLLRCLAGLEPRVHGRLQIGTDIWQDADKGVFLPVHQRAVGYVFQNGRLFPHMTAGQNLEYARKRAVHAHTQAECDEIVHLLGLQNLLSRLPGELSGGEQQRVAIGRALLTRPRLLLMDEPLASLDMHRKNEIMPYLESLHRQLNVPVIYVTHALNEVTRLADTLVLLDDGRTQAAGPVAEILSRVDSPLARLDEAGTIITGVVAGHDDHYQLTEVSFSGGTLRIAHQVMDVGTTLRVFIYARDVSLALSRPADTSILNVLEASVEHCHLETGGQVTVGLRVGEYRVLSRITRLSCERLGLQPGKTVYAQIKSVALAR